MPTAGIGSFGGRPSGSTSTIGGGGSGNPSSLWKLYGGATEQQMGDYDNIMSNYKKMFQEGPSANFKDAIGKYKGFSETGGYSDADLSNLRERGISPLRSIYANANRDVDRQRALQGGYSPNYAASKAKMARELSETMGGQLTKVNADIADRVQSGKLQGLQGYGNMSIEENRIPRELLQGMTSLYGTTPALAQLFGSQALQGDELQNRINTQGQGNMAEIIKALLASLR